MTPDVVTSPDDLSLAQKQALAMASARMRMAAAGGGGDVTPAAPAGPSGSSGGFWTAAGEGLANAIPGGQKLTSAIGAAGAKLAGDNRSFGELYDQANADTAATAAAHPWGAGIGTAAGVVSSLPLALGATRAIGTAASAIPGVKTAAGALSGLGTPAADAGILARAGNLGIRSAKGATVAAPVGALYGAANDTTGNTLDAAGQGAETAAKVGAAIPVAGAVLAPMARGLGAARDFLNRETVSGQAAAQATSSGVPAADTVVMGKIIKRLRADYPDDVSFNAALQKYVDTKDAGLAEVAGKNTQNLATGSAQYPSGNVAAQNYFFQRLAAAPARIAKTFADQVSSNKDYFGTLDDVMAKGRAKATPLYDEAYAANKTVVSPEVDKILATPAGKQALAAARNKMMNDRSLMGLPDKELGEQARDAAAMGEMAKPEGGVAAGLNLRSLDYVKRALDDQIGAAYRAGENDNGRILVGLKNDLVNALDGADKTGAYARARQVSGDYIRTANAMDEGKSFLKPSVQPEEIKAKFDSLGDTEKEAYKAGMVRAVKEQMDKAVGNEPNLYNKVFGSPSVQNKLRAVLNPSEFDVLSKNLKAEQDLYNFRYQVLGNSRTAEKIISAEEFQSGGKEFLQGIAKTGDVSGAVKKVGAQWVGKLFDGLSNKTAGQVANVLYETDPAKKLEILKNIQNSPGLSMTQKQQAVGAYFTVQKLFNNMTKNTGIALGSAAQDTSNGGSNAQ